MFKKRKNPKPLYACLEAAKSSSVGCVCKSFHNRSWKYISRTIPRLKYLGCHFLLCLNWFFLFCKVPQRRKCHHPVCILPLYFWGIKCTTPCPGICSSCSTRWVYVHKHWIVPINVFPLSLLKLEINRAVGLCSVTGAINPVLLPGQPSCNESGLPVPATLFLRLFFQNIQHISYKQYLLQSVGTHMQVSKHIVFRHHKRT